MNRQFPYKSINVKVKGFFIPAFVLLMFETSCEKLVATDAPVTALTSENVYSSDATAAAVLTGLYTQLALPNPRLGGTTSSISLSAGLSADELTLYGGASNSNTGLVQFYLNQLNSSATAQVPSIWNDLYSKLYIVNLAIERLSVSNSLSTTVKQQLTGEAKFLRAFFYFYLVNLYGDVPLTTTSDYRINAEISRTPATIVYDQIIADLKDAQILLSDRYVAADAKTVTIERVRPNQWAATALLARAYLYKGDWLSAETEASAVISNSSLYDTVILGNVFLRNSKEAIWQLQPVNTGWNTEDARFLILPASGPTTNSSADGYPVYSSSQLLTGFETGDQRKVNWMDSVVAGGNVYYYPYKYKSATLNTSVTEYTMVLRLGEQYLIRAEARANQNKLDAAKADLNIIRTRAVLPNTTASNQSGLLKALQHERQVELFTEWGHRWLDLKRTGNIDAVMNDVGSAKGASWNSNWQWYPLPLYDIIQNPNLRQNEGY